MSTSLTESLLTPSGDPVDLELEGEDCGECLHDLSDETDEVVGLIGEDDQGLPGFALFHATCLENRMLRLL